MYDVEGARQLTSSGKIQRGLKRTVAEKRAQLAIESIMLEPEFSDLFSKDELDAARWRLQQAAG